MSIGKELTTSTEYARLGHRLLATVAREHMLWGHLIDRALMPELIIAVDMSAMEAVAIDEWMGASPNYTARMRRLMGIDGDTVGDLMKALQLDAGFVHGYMDVGYRLIDADHGEFWLEHCGALLDAEPLGEAQVLSMCHHIEDPTFDATAAATNPRARIRPIHRPPRVPSDRVPVCHWSIEIDASNDPLATAAITTEVARLALLRVPLTAVESTGDGLDDYRREFIPAFRLDDLSSGALKAVAREFDLQAHLVAAAGALAIEDRHGHQVATTVSAAQAVGVSWVGARRLAQALGLMPSPGEPIAATDLARVLAVHPLWPAGVEATLSAGEAGLSLGIEAAPGLLDPAAPGWLGLIARGDYSAVAAAVQSLAPSATVGCRSATTDRLDFDIALAAAAEPAAIPRVVELLNFSGATDWVFSAG